MIRWDLIIPWVEFAVIATATILLPTRRTRLATRAYAFTAGIGLALLALAIFGERP